MPANSLERSFFSKLNARQKLIYIIGCFSVFAPLIPLIPLIILDVRKKNIHLFIYVVGRCYLYLGVVFVLIQFLAELSTSFMYVTLAFSEYARLFVGVFSVAVWVAAYAEANRNAREMPRLTRADTMLVVLFIAVILFAITIDLFGQLSFYGSATYKCMSICQEEGFPNHDIDMRNGMPDLCTCFDNQGNEKQFSLS